MYQDHQVLFIFLIEWSLNQIIIHTELTPTDRSHLIQREWSCNLVESIKSYSLVGSKVFNIGFMKYELKFTCISGSIPFPKIAAIMEMEVNALKTLADSEDSKE